MGNEGDGLNGVASKAEAGTMRQTIPALGNRHDPSTSRSVELLVRTPTDAPLYHNSEGNC
jgi:hypothetical protein